MNRPLLSLALLLLLALACALPGQATPTPAILVDSFFSGYAYLDANGDGLLDESDPPLKGAICTATDARGIGSGGVTGDDGYAMIWWPASSEYPVTIRCAPPDGSPLTLVGPQEVMLQEDGSGGPARFLFAAPAGFSQHRCGDGVCDGPETEKAQRLAGYGFVVVAFDPDGRGQSGGSENHDGFIQQDGLAAVVRAAATLPGVDAAAIGVVSYSPTRPTTRPARQR